MQRRINVGDLRNSQETRSARLEQIAVDVRTGAILRGFGIQHVPVADTRLCSQAVAPSRQGSSALCIVHEMLQYSLAKGFSTEFGKGTCPPKLMISAKVAGTGDEARMRSRLRHELPLDATGMGD